MASSVHSDDPLGIVAVYSIETVLALAPGIWLWANPGRRRQGEYSRGLGGALFLVLLLTMLNTFGVSAGVRFLLTGLIIVAVITVAGGPKAVR